MQQYIVIMQLIKANGFMADGFTFFQPVMAFSEFEATTKGASLFDDNWVWLTTEPCLEEEEIPF